MPPRRRRCVRQSANSEPKHFLKVILPSAINANQLRIPEEFIRRFGDELLTVAAITVPDGCVWKMRLKKCGKDVWFCNDWQKFAKYYSISYGSFLVFKYEGNSSFHVLIFDITAAEICYPSKSRGTNGEPNLDNNTHPKCPRKRSWVDYQHHGFLKRSKKHREENQVEITGVDNVNLRSKGKPRKKERSISHRKQGKSGCNQNYTSTMSSSSSERAKDAANKLKPKNPSFMSTINPCLPYQYVPAHFSKYLKLKRSMKIQNSNGEQWEVSCVSYCRTSAATRIVKVWSKFGRKNHLSLSGGDDCKFELIKRKPVV